MSANRSSGWKLNPSDSSASNQSSTSAGRVEGAGVNGRHHRLASRMRLRASAANVFASASTLKAGDSTKSGPLTVTRRTARPFFWAGYGPVTL